MEDSYLLNLDGTGYFSSKTLYSDACMEKVSANDEVTYYLQAVGAALVHPDFKEVVPLCPEIIRKQDGETKMHCERNAIRRMLGKLRQDHPHMKFIVNEDALASNAPHIKDQVPYLKNSGKGDWTVTSQKGVVSPMATDFRLIRQQIRQFYCCCDSCWHQN